MKRFGPGFVPPEIERVPTPVGAPCLYCEELIAEGDDGVVMPFTDMAGTKEVAEHHECFCRSIFGSVGHQLGTCSCFGGSNEDPPEMTKRQAAKAATELFKKKLGN